MGTSAGWGRVGMREMGRWGERRWGERFPAGRVMGEGWAGLPNDRGREGGREGRREGKSDCQEVRVACTPQIPSTS